ncbi:CRISPR-associated ring nuclease Csm6 [Aquisalimonas sp.]|uniref:CRISPR-associated ring nuclease Csm6 n=1 Tax=Aquisalimonas sp. TaxID=1872621 RepID=UPI0025C6DEAE|nr:CRISPR-associated ring nuclease Csm6 [Aquisalimonas sp.]
MALTCRGTLLFVTGLTPQIVTETVFALMRETEQRGAPQVPERIEAITTSEGRRRLALTLFSACGGQGYFERLCADYGIDRDAVTFDESCIHVIRDKYGVPLPDITDESHNAAAADLINERVRALCCEPAASLHVSLAGGRKTMGYYAGYALSLYARPGDRLSHVLVNPPFESHPGFFYPPPHPNTLVISDGGDYVSTADARVVLSDIPFVRLREGLDDTLLEGDLSFSEAVARAQQMLEEAELVIDLSERRVWLQGHAVSLPNTSFTWLVWFARRAQQGRPRVAFDETAADELIEVIRWLEGAGPSRLADAAASARAELAEMGKANYFDRSRTRLNAALGARSGLHPAVAERYHVHAHGQRPRTQYGLRLRPEQIHLRGEP